MAEERLQQAGIARYQAIENLAREMFGIAAGAAIAQWQRNAARDTFRDMEKMKTLPLKQEALRKAAYNNEMDFSLWQVQWEEVVCNCNKFNKVQALMIGHQSNETIYTALCTIADVAFMTYYGFASVSSFFFSVNIRVSLLCPCPNAMSIL